MSSPVLPYETPRDRRPWWRSYDAAVVGVLVFAPIVILTICGTWPRPRRHIQARQPAIVTRVQALRSQVALFKLQHNARLPGVVPLVSSGGPAAANQATFWAQMTQYTDVDGNTSPMKTATHVYGPYVLAAPTNPINNSATIAPAAAAASASSTTTPAGPAPESSGASTPTAPLIPQ